MDLLTEKVWLKPDGFAEVQESVFRGYGMGRKM